MIYIYGEHGRYPLKIDIESRISFWPKELSGKEIR